MVLKISKGAPSNHTPSMVPNTRARKRWARKIRWLSRTAAAGAYRSMENASTSNLPLDVNTKKNVSMELNIKSKQQCIRRKLN